MIRGGGEPEWLKVSFGIINKELDTGGDCMILNVLNSMELFTFKWLILYVCSSPFKIPDSLMFYILLKILQ